MLPAEITWDGGIHDFLFTIPLWRALQDRCDAGPEWVLNRLRTGQWRVDDVIEPIRLGLEGGGMKKEDARRLVAKHVENRPLSLSVLTAQLVIAACLYDRGDDTVGDQLGEVVTGVETSPSPVAAGASAGSTPLAS